MALLDGKKVAQNLYEKLKQDAMAWKEKGVQPKLVIILVGDNPASLSYIRGKTKASETVGIVAELRHYPSGEMTTEKLIDTIHELNNDPKVHGILVQLPLPNHIQVPLVMKAIAPQKDVDGFTAYNLGKMFLSKEFEELVPCTPMGVIRILEYYSLDIVGKEVVMVGASNLVGKPLSVMLMNRKATVTICHSKTKDLASHTQKADILIVAVGRARFITADMVKSGAVVIDVGINKDENGKIVGDVDFGAVAEKSSYITPVPGGCGPMTIACLIENVLKAVSKQHQI